MVWKKLIAGVVLSVGAVTSLAVSPVAVAQTEPLADMIERVSPAVVRVYEADGTGSGFIIQRDGSYYVVTNQHTIDSGSPSVVLDDGTQLRPQVVAQTAIADLAILHLNTTRSLASLDLATSARIGEDVVLLGFPLNLRGSMTITRGIISAFRQSRGVDLIQTDAASNPGNSGGPMLNRRGQVVGVMRSVAIDDDGNDAQGISYAVRYDALKAFVDQHLGAPTPLTPTNYEPTFYGPMSGELAYTPEESAVAEATGVFLRDSIIEAWFRNPHDGFEKPWSHGFYFRNTDEAEAHLIAIRSDGNWTHQYFPPTGEGEQWIWSYSTAIDVRKDAYNHLRVIALDGFAWVFINRIFAGATVLRAHTDPGGVFITSGIWESDTAATVYEDFMVRSICCE